MKEPALTSCLDGLAWGFRPMEVETGTADAGDAADIRWWVAERGTPEGPFRVEVGLGPAWLFVTIRPFLDTRGETSFELSRWLLRQNWEMHQAKFSYDPEGRVILSVELPTEALDPIEVETALRTLVDEAARHLRLLRDALA